MLSRGVQSHKQIYIKTPDVHKDYNYGPPSLPTKVSKEVQSTLYNTFFKNKDTFYRRPTHQPKKTFIQEFRTKHNCISRYLKQQSNRERKLVNYQNNLTKVEQIKRKNSEESLLWKERNFYEKEYKIWTGRSASYKAHNFQPDQETRKRLRRKAKLTLSKAPSKLTVRIVDPRILPDTTKPPLTIEDLSSIVAAAKASRFK